MAAAQQGADGAASAWRTVRAAKDIQFAPLPAVPPKPPAPPPEPPAFLKWIFDALEALFKPIAQFFGAAWGGIEILLILLAIAGVAWIAWSLLWPMWRDRKPRAAVQVEAEWAPERAAAVALLDDADRLAAEGRYGEAAHLLLQRSVHHIAAERPEWLTPSSTSREIGRISGLPWRAKEAFGLIAREVERSLFALQELGADDWHRARTAYADFALADLRRGG